LGKVLVPLEFGVGKDRAIGLLLKEKRFRQRADAIRVLLT
jgi:hypothetical protein